MEPQISICGKNKMQREVNQNMVAASMEPQISICGKGVASISDDIEVVEASMEPQISICGKVAHLSREAVISNEAVCEWLGRSHLELDSKSYSFW